MPSLVIVSGLPASGKSTLSQRLASDLDFPLLSRDRMRGAAFIEIAEALPPGDGWRIGRAIDLLINEIANRLFDAGVGVVVDSNFNWVQQSDAIRRLIAQRSPHCYEVCLWAEPEVLRQRFVERDDPPLSPELEPIFAKAVARPREPVLGPPHPVVEFDTSTFDALDEEYDALVAAICSHFYD